MERRTFDTERGTDPSDNGRGDLGDREPIGGRPSSHDPAHPGIGDPVEILFDGCDPLVGSVIWRRGYRLGLDFGQPVIDLIPSD